MRHGEGERATGFKAHTHTPARKAGNEAGSKQVSGDPHHHHCHNRRRARSLALLKGLLHPRRARERALRESALPPRGKPTAREHYPESGQAPLRGSGTHTGDPHAAFVAAACWWWRRWW